MRFTPLQIFFIAFALISIPLCVLPINLFNGEVVIGNDIQTIVDQRPLSLSYFFGLGYDKADMDIIKDFYLLPSGMILAVIFTLGVPCLIAYRVYLTQQNRKND